MSDKDYIVADYLDGMTALEVARKYGRSHKGVQVCLSRWGVTLDEQERKYRRAQGMKAKSCVKQGM